MDVPYKSTHSSTTIREVSHAYVDPNLHEKRQVVVLVSVADQFVVQPVSTELGRSTNVHTSKYATTQLTAVPIILKSSTSLTSTRFCCVAITLTRHAFTNSELRIEGTITGVITEQVTRGT
jgi:hypothetical protein